MATKKRKAAKKSKSAKKAKAPARRSASAAAAAAASPRRDVDERVAALSEARLITSEDEDNLQGVLKILRDREEPAPVRLAALQTIQAASFASPAFEAVRGDYIATLREVAQDADRELRQSALGILAREKDGFAQKKLMEGLQDPEKALVPPEKALQLLSYDVHAEAYPIARAIISKPPNTAAKREALRLLAADATAAPVFEKVLRDKDELPEIRQISASALHALRPERLQSMAREILLDTSEQEDIQAASLTALTQFGDDAAMAEDKDLLKRVDDLSGKASKKLKQGARQFLSRYGR